MAKRPVPLSRAANRFDRALAERELPPLTAGGIDTLQVNVGKLCNQACRHCHVDAGPHQTGSAVNMSADTAAEVLRVLREGAVRTLDLTGGAPELNPNFRDLVRGARALGVHVMDRCNLSVLFEPGQEDLAGFLRDHRVEVVASLPYFRRERTDRQRGAGVFDRSIAGLQRLHELGYGRTPELQLNLVFNPVGAYLPGAQAGLEAAFKQELRDQHGIEFHNLYCITNMPIARFAGWLEQTGHLQGYLELLGEAFNPAALPAVMCRSLVSVGPDGTLYDCDFNQMAGLPVDGAAPGHIRDFDASALARRRIVTSDHCLGCTAGAGSSCGGTLTGTG